jgi:hypothetical protein
MIAICQGWPSFFSMKLRRELRRARPDRRRGDGPGDALIGGLDAPSPQ